jgi:hypothetical protein
MKLIFTIFTFFFIFNSNSQDTLEKIIHPKKKYNLQQVFGFELYGTSKVQFETEYDKLLKSKPLPSLNIKYGVLYNHNKKYDFKATLSIGLLPYNLNFSFDTPKQSVFYTNSFYKYETLDFENSNWSYFNLYTSLSGEVIRKFNAFNDRYTFGLGISYFYFPIDYSTGYDVGYDVVGNESYTTVLKYESIDSLSRTSLISLNSTLSKLIKINSRTTLSIGISVNYSPFYKMQANYSFFNLGFENNGVWKQSINYIGIRTELIRNK